MAGSWFDEHDHNEIFTLDLLNNIERVLQREPDEQGNYENTELYQRLMFAVGDVGFTPGEVFWKKNTVSFTYRREDGKLRPLAKVAVNSRRARVYDFVRSKTGHYTQRVRLQARYASEPTGTVKHTLLNYDSANPWAVALVRNDKFREDGAGNRVYPSTSVFENNKKEGVLTVLRQKDANSKDELRIVRQTGKSKKATVGTIVRALDTLDVTSTAYTLVETQSPKDPSVWVTTISPKRTVVSTIEQTKQGFVVSCRKKQGSGITIGSYVQIPVGETNSPVERVYYDNNGAELSKLKYTWSGDGLLQKREVEHKKQLDGVPSDGVVCAKDYVYNAKRLKKTEITCLYDALKFSGDKKDFYDSFGRDYNALGGWLGQASRIIKENAYVPEAYREVFIEDVFEFMLDEVDALIKSRADVMILASLVCLKESIQQIARLKARATAGRVAALVSTAFSAYTKVSGRLLSGGAAMVRFFLGSISARYGVMTSADHQCDYLDNAVSVICDTPALKLKREELCAVAVWAIEGLKEPTTCADGYAFDPANVSATAQICSNVFAGMSESDSDPKDTSTLLHTAVKDARPVKTSNSRQVALRIINVALARCGVSKQVVALDENSTESVVAKTLLDQCRRSVLLAQNWSFATRDIQLSTHKNTLLNPCRWQFCAHLPSGCLTVDEIWSGRRETGRQDLVPFETIGSRLYCDVESPWIRYVDDSDLSLWPEVALDALAWQLAFELTMPLTVKPDLAMTLQKMAELALQRASAHDKNNRQRDELAPGKFLTARR